MDYEASAYSQFVGALDMYVSSKLNLCKTDPDIKLKEISVDICSLLRERGINVLSLEDFNLIKQALNDIKINKNMKKVLDDYNKSIEDFMTKDVKHE